mmetsp:Transcript_21454/g.43483  ORF Transcript_21454/g.43483 Transcript_21454/m.43483 type:complete len:251 (+) Transcript_21454:1488-2240(+)
MTAFYGALAKEDFESEQPFFQVAGLLNRGWSEDQFGFGRPLDSLLFFLLLYLWHNHGLFNAEVDEQVAHVHLSGRDSHHEVEERDEDQNTVENCDDNSHDSTHTGALLTGELVELPSGNDDAVEEGDELDAEREEVHQGKSAVPVRLVSHGKEKKNDGNHHACRHLADGAVEDKDGDPEHEQLANHVRHLIPPALAAIGGEKETQPVERRPLFLACSIPAWLNRHQLSALLHCSCPVQHGCGELILDNAH